MSTSEQITRINQARNDIRTKLVEMNLVESSAKIDELATAIKGIANNGSVTANVKEGETYTIPAGYHSGSGTVSGVAGGGNYELQSKTVTPTKSEQNITPDAGSYGLSDVTVAPIPENYQDVSSVDAKAGDVLANKKYVDATGKLIAGTMVNNGAVSKTLNTETTSYTIPAGYHSGTGKVSITTETKTVTPTKAEQTISPSVGKVFSEVTVNPIPDDYAIITGVTASPGDVLTGKFYVDAEGNITEGEMPHNSDTIEVLDCTKTLGLVKAGYHDGSCGFEIFPEEKTATPSKETQTINASSGKVISKVTINPIPNNYQDISNVTVLEDEVLAGKIYVGSDGIERTGTMPKTGAILETIDGLTTTSVTIPLGYTTGGTVSLTSDIENMLAEI